MMPFKRPREWAAWLDKHHATSSGVWLMLAKKSAGIISVSYDEALEVALCYGWIDGRKKSHDELSWLQKFSPRGAKSIWSKVNREKAEDLIRHGKVRPAGLKAVESAKQDGRWDTAYDSPSGATVPNDLQAELDKSAKAKAFFATLDGSTELAEVSRNR